MPQSVVEKDDGPVGGNQVLKRGSVTTDDTGVKYLKAEDTLFTVHTHFLVAHSPVFRDMLHVAQANEGEGSSEDRPIFLPQIRAADLDMLVRLIYTPCALPQASPLLTATVEQCLSLIKLLECWLMDDFLEGVRQVLRDVQWSLPDKIALGEGTDMGVGWSSGAWYDLVDRAVPPTLEEGERMGWKAYELVRHIRERAANLPALVRWGVICEHLRAAMPESFVRPAPPSPLDPETHNATCDSCDETIVGPRFKCVHPDCPDYDHCASCEADSSCHPADHPFLKINLPCPISLAGVHLLNAHHILDV